MTNWYNLRSANSSISFMSDWKTKVTCDKQLCSNAPQGWLPVRHPMLITRWQPLLKNGEHSLVASDAWSLVSDTTTLHDFLGNTKATYIVSLQNRKVNMTISSQVKIV